MRASLAVAAAMLMAACAGASAETATYETMAEARPAVEAGRIPSGLPPSSYEMRAAWVPGSWERWGIINFPAAGARELQALLEPGEISLQGMRCDVPGRIEWWPVQLRGALDAERIRATGATAHRARTRNLLFVVNWSQGRAYYWTVP